MQTLHHEKIHHAHVSLPYKYHLWPKTMDFSISVVADSMARWDQGTCRNSRQKNIPQPLSYGYISRLESFPNTFELWHASIRSCTGEKIFILCLHSNPLFSTRSIHFSAYSKRNTHGLIGMPMQRATAQVCVRRYLNTKLDLSILNVYLKYQITNTRFTFMVLDLDAEAGADTCHGSIGDCDLSCAL